MLPKPSFQDTWMMSATRICSGKHITWQHNCQITLAKYNTNFTRNLSQSYLKQYNQQKNNKEMTSLYAICFSENIKAQGKQRSVLYDTYSNSQQSHSPYMVITTVLYSGAYEVCFVGELTITFGSIWWKKVNIMKISKERMTARITI